MNNKIQFMYIRDIKCPERVMTVSTQLQPEAGTIKVAFTVNRVARKVDSYFSYNSKAAKVTTVTTEVFDAYDKQQGKMIVVARLNKANEEGKSTKNYTFVNPSRDVPMKVFVLEQLSKDKSLQTHVRGLAKQKLAEMAARSRAKKAVCAAPCKAKSKNHQA